MLMTNPVTTQQSSVERIDELNDMANGKFTIGNNYVKDARYMPKVCFAAGTQKNTVGAHKVRAGLHEIGRYSEVSFQP